MPTQNKDNVQSNYSFSEKIIMFFTAKKIYAPHSPTRNKNSKKKTAIKQYQNNIIIYYYHHFKWVWFLFEVVCVVYQQHSTTLSLSLDSFVCVCVFWKVVVRVCISHFQCTIWLLCVWWLLNWYDDDNMTLLIVCLRFLFPLRWWGGR